MKLQVRETLLKSKYRVNVFQNHIRYPRSKKPQNLICVSHLKLHAEKVHFPKLSSILHLKIDLFCKVIAL